jgi:hypothetical protein
VAAGAANEIAIGSSSDDIQIDGDFTVSGSKSFKILHPTKADYWLHHSAYEGDVAGGNLYRRDITTISGSAVLIMPDWFDPLNKDVVIFVQADRHFGRAYATANGNAITVTSDSDGDYHLIIFGTRRDGATDDFDVERPMYDSQIFERDYVKPELERIEAAERKTRTLRPTEREALKEKFKADKNKTYIDDGAADKSARAALRKDRIKRGKSWLKKA